MIAKESQNKINCNNFLHYLQEWCGANDTNSSPENRGGVRGGVQHKKSAFTLAEVLITLGIIGVVAALTLPSFITKYQKKQTATRLKHAYSVLFQAVQRSEVDNGPTTDWDYEITDMSQWVGKYVEPYIKYVKQEKLNSAHYFLTLSNGTKLTFAKDGATQIQVRIILNPKAKILKTQRNTFLFYIGYTDSAYFALKNVKTVRPFDYFWQTPSLNNITRDFWKDSSTYGCKNEGHLCAGLIMYDNWEIKDDYPW